MNKIVYIFNEDDVIHSYDDLRECGRITTHFEVSKYSVIDTSEAREDYSIELVSERGDLIAKGLTREEYDALPNALKKNVTAYEVLSVSVRELKD